MAVLRRHPDREQVVRLVVGGDRPARLHRHRREPGQRVARAHHVCGRRERAIDIAADLVPVAHRDLRAARVQHGLERLVVDLDQLGGVLGERARLRQHRRHRLARVAHLVPGEHRVSLGRDLAALDALDRQIAHAALQVGRGDHAYTPSSPSGTSMPPMPGMGERAAHECDVRGSGRLDVVEVARTAAQDALVLPAANRAADERAGQSSSCPTAITSFLPGDASCRSHAAATSSSGTTSRSTVRRPATACSRTRRYAAAFLLRARSSRTRSRGSRPDGCARSRAAGVRPCPPTDRRSRVSPPWRSPEAPPSRALPRANR